MIAFLLVKMAMVVVVVAMIKMAARAAKVMIEVEWLPKVNDGGGGGDCDVLGYVGGKAGADTENGGGGNDTNVGCGGGEHVNRGWWKQQFFFTAGEGGDHDVSCFRGANMWVNSNEKFGV